MFFKIFERRKKEEEVKFMELEKWMNESEHVKNILSEFQSELQERLSETHEALGKTLSSLKKLEAVDLENKKANEKVKEIVLQNKERYAGYAQDFLEKLRKELESRPQNFSETEKFILTVSELLDNFSKQSFRAFHISSELIGGELEGVVEGIAAISESIEKIKRIDKNKIRAIMQVKCCLAEIGGDERTLNILEEEISNEQKEKQEIGQKILEVEKKNEEIKKSKEWLEKQNLASNISSLNEALKENSSEASSLFLSLEKPLKKWAWKTQNKKVLAYLEDHMKALKQDSSFEILALLAQVKEDIEQGRLEVDKKRKEHFLETLSRINKDKLVSFIEKEKQLVNAIKECEAKLDNHRIEFADSALLESQKNNLVLEMEKVKKKQRMIGQKIAERKNDIRSLLRVEGIKLIE